MPGVHYMHNLRKGASFVFYSTYVCPVGELISRNNATAVNNKACDKWRCILTMVLGHTMLQITPYQMSLIDAQLDYVSWA